MKKWLIPLLCLLVLAGCAVRPLSMKNPVTFYYVRSDFSQEMTSVIDSDVREASGHSDDLFYLLTLYLMGPSVEGLRSPLPSGTHILQVDQTPQKITITLSPLPETVTDADFTLAAACLSRTCLEITSAQSLTLSDSRRTITMDLSHLILEDRNTSETEEAS